MRLPRTWLVGVALAILAASVTERRQLQELERIGGEIGQYVGTRDREAAEREARLLALTATLTRLTWVLLVATAATLVVAIVTLAST